MALRAENIGKQYFRTTKTSNCFWAVQTTDITVQNGTLTVLIGRSGSGKTTLLNMLSGVLTPTTGRVLLDDTDLYALSDEALARVRSRRMGVIPQGRAVLDTLTVMENVLLPCALADYEMLRRQRTADQPQAAKSRGEELLNRLGMGHLRDAMPGELSGGELRRLSIARALVQKPDVILADEPTGDLDDENTENVFETLRQAADDGAAVVLITHETDAIHYADTALRMQDGVLLPMEAGDKLTLPAHRRHTCEAP